MQCKSDVTSIAFIASLLKVDNIELVEQHWVMLCHSSQSAMRFSLQCHPNGTNIDIAYLTDIESDIAIKRTVAVCEYHGAPST